MSHTDLKLFLLVEMPILLFYYIDYTKPHFKILSNFQYWYHKVYYFQIFNLFLLNQSL